MAYELSEERKKYIAAIEAMNKIKKELRKKHSSKLYKGFCKMCLRQDKKPNDVTFNLPPITLPKNFKGEYLHYFTVCNSKWNGMNLKTLCTQEFDREGGMYSPFTVNPLTKKYSLSNSGKKKLKRMKETKFKNL